QAENCGSSLCGRRQGARCAHRTEIVKPVAGAIRDGNRSFNNQLQAGPITMAYAANAITPDRQRAELAALSAPAVLFTLAMVAFPVVYTVWLSFRAFSSTGRQSFVGLGNYAKLIADNEFWHGLWVTLALYVLSLVLQLVLGVWLALLLFHAKRLPGIVRLLFI